MKLLIHELSKLASVTIRTLHYYDHIGLLTPNAVGSNGYRYYDEENIENLKLILYFKELDFPLDQIKKLLAQTVNKEVLLKQQRHLLQLKRDRLNGMIRTIDNALEGESNMNFKEFDMQEIEKTKQAYAKEVEERWGDTTQFAQSKRKTTQYTQEDWKLIKEEEREIFSSFANISHLEPSSREAMELVRRWQHHISNYFYECSDEILGGLGQMYLQDERFIEHMDTFKEGTTVFISNAIAAFLSKKS
jgi:DNA-binding transcriptional MerR regulator